MSFYRAGVFLTLLMLILYIGVSAAHRQTVPSESVKANDFSLAPRPVLSKPAFTKIDNSAQIALVVVKMNEEAKIALNGGRFVSAAGFDTGRLNSIIATKSSGEISQLIPAPKDKLTSRRFILEQRSRQKLADFSAYFTIAVFSPGEAQSLVNQLNELPEVEIAYPRPISEPAVDIAPPTPVYVDSQVYLAPAPAGIDAFYGQSVAGGDGSGVRIVDIEGSWKLDHEDLELPPEAVLGGDPDLSIDWRNHGSAVIGMLKAQDNGYGITGIVPGVQIGLVSHNGQSSDAGAILNAVDSLEAGDIILIEIQTPGPRYNFQIRTDQAGYVPIEYFQAEFDAMQYAWAKGIIVVEAAANGAENLSDIIYESRFDTTFRNSHAIIVGAGAPPSGNYGTDRKVLDFSNYGARVNVQGYGREIVTCGYGDLFNGSGDERQYYTKFFGGTSGAAPMVAGAVASLQGIYQDRFGGALLDADRMRDILVATGSPQQGFPTYHIGPRPDIRAADSVLPEPYDLRFNPTFIDTTLEIGSMATVFVTINNNSPTKTMDYSIAVPDSLTRSLQSSWLSVSPASGTIAPSGSDIIEVTLDAANIEDRVQTYKGVLEISFGESGMGLDEMLFLLVFLDVPCQDTTYAMSASFQPDGPEFNWIDLTAVGLLIPNYSWYNDQVSSDTLDDGSVGPQLIGFDFPFFDTTYTQVYIGANGALSFTDRDVNINGSFDDIDIPNPPFTTLVAPFWNDLNLEPDDGHGAVYIYRMLHKEGFIVQWNRVSKYDGAPEDTLTTFQIIFYRNGNIKFQYLSVGASDLASTAVIGIAEADCNAHDFVTRSDPPENVVSDSSAVLFDYAPVIWEMSGDANYDNFVNVGDAVYLINWIFRSGPAPQKMEEADPNCDGQANIGDAVFIISYAFRGGPAPCLYEL